MQQTSRVVVGGGTPSIALTRGRGVRVWDEHANEYIDCTSQGWALYLGHANPEIQNHATTTMARMWHTHQGFVTDERERLAERLLGLVDDGPAAYDRVAFTVSGGLAVETALKLATVNNPSRTTVARLVGGFHGTTLGVAQASWAARGDVPPERRSLERFADLGGSFVDLSFPESGDITRDCAILNEELDRHRGTLNAVVVEPIQGSGGQREVPLPWLRRLRDRSRQDGFVVIYDEVQTYVRAGRFYTSVGELAPHLVVLGKGLAGGFACGAVLLRDDLEAFPSGGPVDLHTFGSSALAHSVAVKIVDIVERDGLLEAAHVRGRQLAAGLRQLSESSPTVGAVRQVGLHIGFDVLDPAARAPSKERAGLLRAAALRCGLVVGLGGYRPWVVKVKPPLTITAAEVADVLERLERAVRLVDAR